MKAIGDFLSFKPQNNLIHLNELNCELIGAFNFILMNRKLHYLIFCFLPSLLYSQNLITNSGFESYTQLPTNTGQYYRCIGWGNCSGQGSPDYFHINGSGMVKLPNTFVSWVSPQEGSAVMGFSIYSQNAPNYREYLTTMLTNPLLIGQNYQLSFYITNGTSPVNYGGAAADHFSIALSTSPLIQSDGYHAITTVTPQYVYNGFLYNTDWQLINYSFVADQAYQYLTFGSFVNDNVQQIQQVTPVGYPNAYYFIDNINLNVPLSVEEQEAMAAIKVYQNNIDEILTIETNNTSSLELMLYDLNGRLLIQKIFSTSTIINTSLLSKGIYIYNIKDSEGKRNQGKILIK